MKPEPVPPPNEWNTRKPIIIYFQITKNNEELEGSGLKLIMLDVIDKIIIIIIVMLDKISYDFWYVLII